MRPCRLDCRVELLVADLHSALDAECRHPFIRSGIELQSCLKQSGENNLPCDTYERGSR